MAFLAAWRTAGTSEPVTMEPPERGPGGNAESPSTTSILSGLIPSASPTDLGKHRVSTRTDILGAAGDPD